MKTTNVLLLVGFAFLGQACVTEGVSRSEPESPEAAAQSYLTLGIRYIQEGQPDAAIDRLTRAIEYQPRLADAHSTIAVAYDQIGDGELAEEHHRRATSLARNNSSTQNSFAVFLCRQSRWQDAEPYFTRAIDLDRGVNQPLAMNWMLNAATCARTSGDLESAESYYRSLLDVDATHAAALRGMIDLSIRSGSFFQGRAFWQRLERSVTVDPADLLSCYTIENGMGDEVAARNCADRLRSEFPGSQAVAQLRELERNVE